MASFADYKNWKKIDTNGLIVTGRDLSIEDKKTGKVYLTSDKYMNKLFKELGYRNTNVIKILEEFAGIYITELGSLKDEIKIYVDDTTSSFIVVKEKSMDNFIDMMELLESKVSGYKKYDNYCYWDEITYEDFVIYPCLSEELVYVLSVAKSNGVVVGTTDEGHLSLSDDTFNSNFDATLFTINDPTAYNLSVELSEDEAVNVLAGCGLVKFGRKKSALLDEALVNNDENLISLVENYNSHKPLKRRVTNSGMTYKEACMMITSNLDYTRIWNFNSIFEKNFKEEMDLQQLEDDI